jgi:hypothetical protein
MREIIGLNEANGHFVYELYCGRMDATLVEVDGADTQTVTPRGREILMGVGFIDSAPRDCGLTTTPQRSRTPDSFASCADCDYACIDDRLPGEE